MSPPRNDVGSVKCSPTTNAVGVSSGFATDWARLKGLYVPGAVTGVWRNSATNLIVIAESAQSTINVPPSAALKVAGPLYGVPGSLPSRPLLTAMLYMPGEDGAVGKLLLPGLLHAVRAATIVATNKIRTTMRMSVI